MKRYLFLFFILICSTAYAEKVRVFTDYKPVRILRLVDKGADFETEAAKADLKGNFKDIDDSAIPTDKADRDFWKFEKGEVTANKASKKEREDLKTKKKADKQSAIQKLKAMGLTDEELATLKIGG